jgi:predicted peroxiredoxin
MSKLRVDAYKAVDNGIKETNHVDVMKFFDNKMEDALQNGVKETKYCSPGINEFFLESVIKNGVKETKQKKNAYLILDTSGRELILESHLVVRDGVKETSHRQFLKTYDVKDTIQDVNEHDRWILDGCDDPVDEVLDNGVKITASLQSREYTGDIDEVLGDGVKTSHPRQYVGENIIDKIIETHRDICEYKHTVDYIIQTGIKETHDDVYHHKGRIDGVIKNGVKETVAAGYTDPKTNLLHIKWGTQIDDVLDNGEKINGTYAGGQRQSEKCKSVVEYGTKNPTD